MGIGYLLHKQSNEQSVTKFLSKFLQKGAPMRDFFKKQVSMKLGKDYDFEVRIPARPRCAPS